MERLKTIYSVAGGSGNDAIMMLDADTFIVKVGTRPYGEKFSYDELVEFVETKELNASSKFWASSITKFNREKLKAALPPRQQHVHVVHDESTVAKLTKLLKS